MTANNRKWDGEIRVRLRGERVWVQVPVGKVTEAHRNILKAAGDLAWQLFRLDSTVGKGDTPE